MHGDKLAKKRNGFPRQRLPRGSSRMHRRHEPQTHISQDLDLDLHDTSPSLQLRFEFLSRHEGGSISLAPADVFRSCDNGPRWASPTERSTRECIRQADRSISHNPARDRTPITFGPNAAALPRISARTLISLMHHLKASLSLARHAGICGDPPIAFRPRCVSAPASETVSDGGRRGLLKKRPLVENGDRTAPWSRADHRGVLVSHSRRSAYGWTPCARARWCACDRRSCAVRGDPLALVGHLHSTCDEPHLALGADEAVRNDAAMRLNLNVPIDADRADPPLGKRKGSRANLERQPIDLPR